MPVGVHLAVVDPDVGAERRAVALRLADDRMLVGPDNGLLSLAAERAGGVVEAVDIARSEFRLEPVSATFHGRDIFAPVAARLAEGRRRWRGRRAVRPRSSWCGSSCRGRELPTEQLAGARGLHRPLRERRS